MGHAEKYRRTASLAMGLQGGQFVNAGVIPRVSTVKMTKAVTPPSRNSLERDQGIGTSGEEESSESSLSKNNKRSAPPKLSHVQELYSNDGYLSDEEGYRARRTNNGNNSHLHHQYASPSHNLNSNSISHHPHDVSSSSNNNVVSSISSSINPRARTGSLTHGAHGGGIYSGTNTLPGGFPSSRSNNGNARRNGSKGSYVNEMKFP